MCRGAAVTVLCAQILSFLAMMMQRCTKPEAHFAQHLAASVLPSLGIPADTATEFCRQLSSCVEDPRRMKKAFTVSVAVPAELWCRLPHVASRCGTNSISACDCASCDRARLRRRQGCDSKHERGRMLCKIKHVVVVARSEQNRTEPARGHGSSRFNSHRGFGKPASHLTALLPRRRICHSGCRDSLRSTACARRMARKGNSRSTPVVRERMEAGRCTSSPTCSVASRVLRFSSPRLPLPPSFGLPACAPPY